MRESTQHRLFLAFVPPASVIREVAWIRDCFSYDRPVPDDQLHMTLLSFPLQSEFPQQLESNLIRLLSLTVLPRCRIIVDRLVLGMRSGLLQPSEPVVGLLAFQQALVRLILPNALHAWGMRGFSPHFTLFYGGATRPTLNIDPISWTAEELVLVHSFHGEGRHETLARWPLRA